MTYPLRPLLALASTYPLRPVLALASALLLLTACDDGAGGDAGPPIPGVDAGPVPPGVDAGSPGSCSPAPMACAEMAVADFPVDLMGRNDRGATDDFGGSMCGSGRGGMGGTGATDVAYQFTAPSAGLYEFSTVGSAYDTVLSIRQGCDGAEIACNDDLAQGSQQSVVEVQLEACETVLVVVDGYNTNASGAFRLQVTARESLCEDGDDNDGDGLIDIADPDCSYLACITEGDWDMSWAERECEVLRYTNEARAVGHNCDTRGNFGPTGPLEMDEVIRVAARGHALDMGEQDYFDHVSLDGREFSDRMRNAGFDGAFPWGENIATGQRSAREVVDGWLDSDGHCANIMNPEYHVIGIGFALVESSRYGEQWVQNFAGGH